MDRGQETLDAILERETAPEDNNLSRADRNLLYALVYGVLRWRRPLDRALRHFLRHPRQRIDPALLNILRLGLFQLRLLDRIPDSAAVNTSVELARRNAPRHLTGFVNGILRNAVRHPNQPPPVPEKSDPIAGLAERASFPDWMVRRWVDRFGVEETGQLCDALNRMAPLTLRANSLRISRDRLLEEMADAADAVAPTPFSPDGIRLDGPRRSVADLPGFRDGGFQVQDEAAQLAVRHLAPEPGHRVLDACAGLGGKTAYMAALMENRGEILALDHREEKLERLGREMDRLGVRIVGTAPHDLGHPIPETDGGTFDRILVDAPCSGLGVIRRNPDAKWTRTPRDLPRFQRRQIAFLDRVAPLLASGGRLGYAVCTTEPEETDAVVQAFLKRNPEFRVDLRAEALPAPSRKLVGADGALRLFPHSHNTDGFFSVCFTRVPPSSVGGTPVEP